VSAVTRGLRRRDGAPVSQCRAGARDAIRDVVRITRFK